MEVSGSLQRLKTYWIILITEDRGRQSDPVFKNNGNRIPLTEQEKEHLISFMKTLSDVEFTGH